jgi:hypothetical protein
MRDAKDSRSYCNVRISEAFRGTRVINFLKNYTSSVVISYKNREQSATDRVATRKRM